MGSSADSRYWTCSKCMREYDWELPKDRKHILDHKCPNAKKLARDDLKLLRSSLGYSRIGRGNR